MKLKIICLLLLTPFFLSAENKSIFSLKNIKDPQYSLQSSFLAELVQKFGVDVFVESGTYMGGTTFNAAPFFKEVHSIELSENLYRKANDRFKYQKNVFIHNGDSGTVLNQILPKIQGKILFWLDGHYSEGCTARGEKNTPIIEELNAIKNSGITDAIILIDDIRIFSPKKNILHSALVGYPSVEVLKQLIQDIASDYQFYIYGDVAFAFRAKEPVDVSNVVKACTACCLGKMTDEDSVIIMNAQHEELQTLQALHATFFATEPYGVGDNFRYWYGLTLMKSNIFEAKKQFKKALELGLDARLVERYL